MKSGKGDKMTTNNKKQARRAILTLLSISGLLAVTGCNKKENREDYIIGMDTDYEDCSGLPHGNGKTAKVIILVGQSNCTGCSITSYLKDQSKEKDFARYEAGYQNIKINFNIDNHRNCSEGEFRKTDLMCGSYDEEFGPEVGIADYLDANMNGEEFYILKFSMSGYSLNYHWMWDYERGEIYDAEMMFFKKSLDYLRGLEYEVSLDAICWMQGESDTNEYKGKRYYQNEVNFIKYLREDLSEYSNPRGLYFIDAGISDSPYCLPTYPEINDAKKKISTLSPLNLYFSTIDNGLTTLNEPYGDPDLGHYDALSELKLGHLFGERIASIYKGEAK